MYGRARLRECSEEEWGVALGGVARDASQMQRKKGHLEDKVKGYEPWTACKLINMG